MCGSKPKLPPQVDPRVERERLAAEATQSANAKAAEDRRAKRSQSLLAYGSQPGSATGGQTSSVLALGKDKLGSGG